jgi:TolA-binding protein
MVFSDVDLLSDQLAFVSNPFGLVQAANDNHRVFLNGIDFLLGDRDLMAIRAAKKLSRPFEKFDQIEAAAEKETLDREREIRAEIEQFQEQLRAKQGEITSRNASLLQKTVQDEVDQLNERIVAANRELREIRKGRREAIESQESMVRFSVMGWMPLVLLAIGIWLAYKRRQQARA